MIVKNYEKIILYSIGVVIIFLVIFFSTVFDNGRTTARLERNSADISNSVTGLSETSREFGNINDTSTELGDELQYTADTLQVIADQLRTDNQKFTETNKRLSEIIEEVESTGRDY